MPVSQEYRIMIIGIESHHFFCSNFSPITNKREREAAPRNKAGGNGKLYFVFFLLGLK